MMSNKRSGFQIVGVLSAAMGIRTPVAGVKGPHDWPDYTIAARCCFI
jgi:hypothetical protein